MRSKVNTRKRLAFNNDVRAVECGMNIQTAKRVHQKDIHREKKIKELFDSKAQEEDVEHPKCCFKFGKGKKVL